AAQSAAAKSAAAKSAAPKAAAKSVAAGGGEATARPARRLPLSWSSSITGLLVLLLGGAATVILAGRLPDLADTITGQSNPGQSSSQSSSQSDDGNSATGGADTSGAGA